jgi:hypothetical protein
VSIDICFQKQRELLMKSLNLMYACDMFTRILVVNAELTIMTLLS